jgi:hypothetical protein
VQKIGSLNDGNASFDRADEGAGRAPKLSNGEVVGALVIAKADMHLVSQL